ncbi:hypothetical protein B0T26DRAFT_677127 [Lasiosphaeria miniovina]|uniref:Nucleoporin NUP37 n=1 Tax=Lasiosphaeria miniovina TaxID=1954250 RepID=A0AA40DTC5_9PEZI|nr:uncharacterized protein B0T26DRAFT_677127 [Lasiosphaeria miniovina]KAK0712701.1 hypothetical protein B0T26DRAFT_677127 [Lasiosphaeria miniovina]
MQPIPRTRRTAQNTQYTYTLDYRVHDVKTYPVQSPQGASVLIYGHDNGITLLWRGGQRLKAPKPSTEGHNGSSSQDAVMILDSDDDDPSPSAPTVFVDKPEFENPAAPSSPLPEITQTLDLAFGTAILQIAVLPMSPCGAEDAAWNGAEILKTKLVFAVTCATNDTYVVTLPLTPPSHESKLRPELRQGLLAGSAGKGLWGETLTLLGGQARPSEGIAMTLVKQKPGSRSRSLERAAASKGPVTRAIVSAYSREASGTLRFWDVTLDSTPGHVAHVDPFQTEYLPSPLASISFNPLNVTQLLTIASPHAVRIYDYSIPSLPSDDTSEGPFPTQGSWLVSLYPPFTRGSAMSTARKPIIAADWIAHGRAILTLLADGQWGIWDINGGGPTSSSGSGGSLFSKAGAGLRGSAITSFSVSGHMEGTSPLRNPAAQNAAPSSGEFVPMTPHTRRDAIAASMIGGSEKLAAVRGGIHVAKLAPRRGAEPGDESAILWLGGADPIVSVIPVISRFWDAQLRRAGGGGVNLWSGAQPTRMIRLADLSVGLLGERCTGAIAIPKQSRSVFGTKRPSSPGENGTPSPEGLPVEVLVQGESRIVVVHESEEATSSLTSRLVGARKKTRPDNGTAKAILAFPRPEKPNSVAFNLSVSRAGAGLLRQRPRGSAKGLFGDVDEPVDIRPSTEAPDAEGQAPNRPRDAGLMFINDLNFAADVPDDESEAAERDIEQEMRDIMEIDRELEQMESDRERGTKRVFFEEG